MTRRFALALIVLVVAQFCVLYAWQRYERNAGLEEITTSLMVTNRMAIAGQEELLSMKVMSYEELMQDDAKAKFIHLLHFVVEHHSGYEILVADENAHAFRKQATAFIEAIATDYKTMMMDQYEDVDLRKEDAVGKCTKMDGFTANALTGISEISNHINPALRNQMVQIITLDYVQHVLMDVIYTCSSKTIICDYFFPVFNADRSAYRSGGSMNAKVGVGSYSTSLNPDNVVLTIDGKEYPIDPDGTAKFQTSERKRGQHTLKTKVVITNPLTGEVQSGEGSFTYEVY